MVSVAVMTSVWVNNASSMRVLAISRGSSSAPVSIWSTWRSSSLLQPNRKWFSSLPREPATYCRLHGRFASDGNTAAQRSTVIPWLRWTVAAYPASHDFLSQSRGMSQMTPSARFMHRAPDLPTAMIRNVMLFSMLLPDRSSMFFALTRHTIWSPKPTERLSRRRQSLAGSLSLLPWARRSRMNRWLMSRTCAFVPAIRSVDLPSACHLTHIWYASSSMSRSSPQWIRSCAMYSSTS